MDIVDTFNHLIPSDQLDESLSIGQNFECEAGNDFGTGARPEDSLKNMLSDKDPMFGCAGSQFNLLDSEDTTFQMAGSTGLDGSSASTGVGSQPTQTTQVKRPPGRPRKRPPNTEDKPGSGPEPAKTLTNTVTRGRPGRKPADRLQKSFLIDKGVKGAQLKKELSSGGRINVNDLDGRLWLKPSVVLRRLTVTIGGFRIELLPGPSYTHNVETNQSACFEDGISFAVLPDVAANVQNPVPENAPETDVTVKSSSDDAVLGLGPYVNPNDVQTANGTVTGSDCSPEKKVDNQSVAAKPKPLSKGKDNLRQMQNNENDGTTVGIKPDVKEKQQTVTKTLLKAKGPTPNKNNDMVSCKPNNSVKGHKVSQNQPSTVVQREDLHRMKSLKEKKDIGPLKRPTEITQSEHATKMQKIQGTGDSKVKPKLPTSPSSGPKKIPSSGARVDPQSPTKPTHLHNSSKAEAAHPPQGRPGNASKTPDDGQDKAKPKRPEKILLRQKSKTSRSISVDEPQLFIPDNAPPVVKKDSAEEQPANNDGVWDGNNCCGLCRKHHNNMFMVGCGRCEDWFHGDCVGLDLTKVREMEEEDQMYVCLKCCEDEVKKVEPEPPSVVKVEAPVKTEDPKPPPKPRPGPSQTLTSGGVRPVRKDPDRRHSADGKESAHKTGTHLKHEPRSKTSSSASKKPVSSEAIRRSVRDSLKEILIQRLKESDLNISVERACEVAKKTERELFHLYKDTDNKYKNKYRSLTFNLKDTKNNVLFRRVLKGDISPGNLIRMSPEELASKELAAWRQRENRHTIEMIEKEQREAEMRPITKITHKGEIEIESQEPAKVPEPEELELPPNVAEVSAEPPKTPKKKAAESAKAAVDTTSQHKSHLFDLHCKICTGHVAPPVEEASTKVLKVATTVVRRQSTKAEDTQKSTAAPAVDDDLHLTVLEESFRNAQSGYEGRLPHSALRDEDSAFLSNLKSLWRGFIHMPNVAKFVTKSFPVSGVLDNLTEDLPDSVQVGGRISPQIVWDYLEKIRATGTKEVCLIRFSPETEEDEIPYALLYAYFSSRRRFGVVSNNLKLVKDMYLIPLGAIEKVPHQLVPFDGPGLENNRGNLLLGLIIRQRPKRDFHPVDLNETARIIPEIQPVAPLPIETRAKEEEEEKVFLSSLAPSLQKEKDKPLDTTEDVEEAIGEPSEAPSASEEPGNPESQKPLRFLPGVLVGWGGELPPLPDFSGIPLIADNEEESPQKTIAPAPKTTEKSPTAPSPRDRFVIKKREAKPVKSEPEPSTPTETPAANSSSVKEAAVVTQSAPISLKDKPPDVSTEAYLAGLSAAPGATETDGASASANQGESNLVSDTEKRTTAEGDSTSQSTAQAPPPAAAPAAAAALAHAKPPLSGILKKSSAYPSVSEEDKTTVLQKDTATLPSPLNTKPVPLLRGITLFHQGVLKVSQAKSKPEEENLTSVRSFIGGNELSGTSQPGATLTRPQASNIQSTELQQVSATAPDPPAYNNNNTTSAPISSQQQTPPQVPDSYECPPETTQDQNDAGSQAIPGLESDSERPLSLPKEHKRPEERYSDPWERPRNAEDREQQQRGRHGSHGSSHSHSSHHRDSSSSSSHHGKKSRHHHDRERDREKKHEREDKYRERSRHHDHHDHHQSDSHYTDKRKDRGDEHGRHKDRHRKRRDSDYENGRRGSKDSSYS